VTRRSWLSLVWAFSSLVAGHVRAEEPLVPAKQAELLQAWFDKLGPVRPDESLGELIVRAGLLQLGKPYFLHPEDRTDEPLRVDLESFECQSFVESTLSVARCALVGQRDTACFAQELERFRYRGGVRRGFASRLHYFSEWIDDNVSRGRLDNRTAALGGQPIHRDFFYFARHAAAYPALADAAARTEMAAVDERLSSAPHIVLDRAGVERAKPELMTGDVIAVVTSKPGALISHTGFIAKNPDGTPCLLHASSHHGRVLLTRDDIARYLRRWPDRQGLMVARPLAPQTP
jgi:hypothetical protein